MSCHVVSPLLFISLEGCVSCLVHLFLYVSIYIQGNIHSSFAFRSVDILSILSIHLSINTEERIKLPTYLPTLLPPFIYLFIIQTGVRSFIR